MLLKFIDNRILILKILSKFNLAHYCCILIRFSIDIDSFSSVYSGFTNSFFPFLLSLSLYQRYFNSGLDLSEARASLLSGDVVELTNASVVDSTSMKLTWQVSNQSPFLPLSVSDFLC